MMSLSRTARRVRARFMTAVNYRGLDVPIDGPHVIRPIIDELMGGRYEVPEIEALQKLMRPGDRLLEIGVGLGVVSGLAARSFPASKITCFEANPDLIAPIRRMHDMNGIANVELINAVLVPGAGGGTREFHIPASFAEGSLLSNDSHLKTVPVPARSFGETLRELQPDVLAIDIEGGEDELLSDADLAGVRALVLELHPSVISRAAEKRIYDTCLAAGLYPRVDLSSANVVAFETVE